jgi:hypothetical protein
MTNMLWLGLVSTIMVACGGNDGVSSQPECTRSVSALTATAGTTPTFTWTPLCRLGGLVVRRVSDGETMWYVRSDGYDMGPPVQYGVTPQGLDVIRQPAPLVAGVTYEVDIAVPGTGGPVPVFGRMTFTP